MGRKRSRKMEHFIFYTACGLISLSILLVSSCSSSPWHTLSLLENADRYMDRDDFQSALKTNKRALQQNSAMLGDKVLYQRGLLHVHPRNSLKDYSQAVMSFKTMLEKYPDSKLSAEADAWLRTLEILIRNEQLTVELNRNIKKLETNNKKQISAINQLESKNNSCHARAEQLHSLIKQLESRLEKLKKVDLGIEKKKRQADGS